MKSKFKTKRALAKRVSKTKNGFKVGHAFRSHLAQSKTRKQKRKLRKSSNLSKADFKRLKPILN